MDYNNHTTYNSKIHYEANQPKLQWLLILIPVAGIFALYTIFRLRNKKRRRKQLQEETTDVIPARMSNIIPYSNTNNCSTISLVRLPQSGDVYINVQNQTEERTVYQAGPNRRDSSQVAVPPPTYSVCSPPRYEEVVDLTTKVNTTSIPA